ncbi:uncharacterized protein LOC143920245 isoform X1 [Arctopsyche grandis]|uniref:uncharacterized protein LOC143920245 isoform X1 n=1 Tax=Arctopsyche grandis TaxID=121162 RepID=UPI00406D7285
MFSIKWRRPSCIPYPQVWRRFEKTIKNGKKLKFKVQDLTEDMHYEVLEFMKKYYMKDEPWSANAGTANDSVAIQMFEEYVQKYVFPQKLSIICVLDDDNANSPGELIGCNLLGVKRKVEVGVYNQLVKAHLYSIPTKRFPNLETRFKRRQVAKSEIDLLAIFNEYIKHCPDVFEKYNVGEYLGAYGLCVRTEYRRMNIASEILRTRLPIMKSLGLTISNTDFTGLAAQKAAYKAGFKVDVSVSYDKIRHATGLPFKNCVNCEMMTLKLE